jgi:hypothetical protein
MKSLRESIQKHDIFRWMRDFMAVAGEEERAIARAGQSEKSAPDAGASSYAKEASGVIAS